MTKKIKLEDVTPEQFEECRNIVRWVVRMQTMQPTPEALEYAHKELLPNIIAKSAPKGFSAELDAGFDTLDTAFASELNTLRTDHKIRSYYCGIWWSWWLARYLCAQALGCELDQTKLNTLMEFCKFCPVVIEMDDGSIVSMKPTKVALREIGKTAAPFELPVYELHADGEPSAIMGPIKTYHWHNMRVPEKYGAVKSTEWNPEWWLKERNMEYRRMLAEGIGYDKLALVLELEERDSWREYTLLRKEQVQGEDEPVQLLKMTCPSTGHVHYSRVAPDIESAEVAATILNAGIHPSLFQGAET